MAYCPFYFSFLLQTTIGKPFLVRTCKAARNYLLCVLGLWMAGSIQKCKTKLYLIGTIWCYASKSSYFISMLVSRSWIPSGWEDIQWKVMATIVCLPLSGRCWTKIPSSMWLYTWEASYWISQSAFGFFGPNRDLRLFSLALPSTWWTRNSFPSVNVEISFYQTVKSFTHPLIRYVSIRVSSHAARLLPRRLAENMLDL